MKIFKFNQKTTFLILIFISSMLLIPTARASPLSVTLSSIPTSKTIGSEEKVYIYSNKKADLSLYVDYKLVGRCGNTYSCWITAPVASTVRNQRWEAKAFLYLGGSNYETDSDVKYIQTLGVSGLPTDFVRTDQMDDTIDLLGEVYKYTHENVPGDIGSDGEIDSVSEKIKAIENFAVDILLHFYLPDSDALTAGEAADALRYFDGETDQWNTFSLYGRSTFECRDMASLISGLATMAGVNSRLITLSNDNTNVDYQHFFAELYGISVNGNNGWFLIDPSHTEGYYNSYNTDNEIINAFGGESNVDRIWIASGWQSGDWGYGVAPDDVKNGWLYRYSNPNPSPPTWSVYSTNPWGFT